MIHGLRKIGKTLTRGLVLFSLWIIVPLLGAEMLAIVVEPYLSMSFYEYDRDIGFRVRGHANGANEFGFNSRDFPHGKDPYKLRILVLGDSFNWAGGRDGNYTALFEKKLNAGCPIQRVEVINAG